MLISSRKPQNGTCDCFLCHKLHTRQLGATEVVFIQISGTVLEKNRSGLTPVGFSDVVYSQSYPLSSHEIVFLKGQGRGRTDNKDSIFQFTFQMLKRFL